MHSNSSTSPVAFAELTGGPGPGNVYQECVARTAAEAAAEHNNNNNHILHKKLSLDIPPAEPAPSPR